MSYDLSIPVKTLIHNLEVVKAYKQGNVLSSDSKSHQIDFKGYFFKRSSFEYSSLELTFSCSLIVANSTRTIKEASRVRDLMELSLPGFKKIIDELKTEQEDVKVRMLTVYQQALDFTNLPKPPPMPSQALVPVNAKPAAVFDLTAVALKASPPPRPKKLSTAEKIGLGLRILRGRSQEHVVDANVQAILTAMTQQKLSKEAPGLLKPLITEKEKQLYQADNRRAVNVGVPGLTERLEQHKKGEALKPPVQGPLPKPADWDRMDLTSVKLRPTETTGARK